MEKNNLHSISGAGLDQLLSKAFMDLDMNLPGNQRMLELVSERVLLKPATAALAFNRTLVNKLLVAFIALVVIGAAWWLTGRPEVPVMPVAVVQPAVLKTPLAVAPGRAVPAAAVQPKEPRRPVSPKTLAVLTSGQEPAMQEALSAAGSERSAGNENVIIAATERQQPAQDEYIFPVLTEKQVRANEKEKKRMARLAARVNPKSRDTYAYIRPPADKTLPAYYMGAAEVTNLEYRTFLFDLLINGKKEEFLIAKPEQNLWLNAAGRKEFDTLSKVYFSDKKYNEHPVVNISVVAAEMYCNWLGDIATEVRQKEGKPALQFRLPYEKEWLYAASSGRAGAVYPWPIDSVQNRVNRFMANCCLQKKYEAFKQPFNYPFSYAVNLKAYTTAGMALNDIHVASVMVWAYNPNDFYLYCTSGNVSEMVFADNTRVAGTKGGSWNSDFEHLKFNSEDEFKGNVTPSPMIGFRVYGREVK